MRNRNSLLRRLPVLAALSLVALSACGSDEPDTSADPVTSVAPGATGAPDTTGTPDTDAPAPSGDLRAPEPIEVLGGEAGAAAAAEIAAAGRAMSDGSATESDAMPTDMMIAPTYVADFVVAEGLPALPENSTGYVYDGATPVTAEQAVEIAAHFGVAGEPVRVDDWEPGGWQIGPTDGSGPSVFVSDDPQQMWSYSPAWQDTPAMPACETPASPDGSPPPSTIECPTPEPPAGVPGAEDAEAQARELLAGLGVDASAMKFDTYADEWSASVNVTEFVATDGEGEGVPSGRYWGFGFGAEGALQWANGLLAAPEEVGPYTLVDLDTAVARLREQFLGNGAPMPLPVDLVDPVAPDAATSDMVDPATSAVPDQPVETYPAPEPVTVTLVDVQPDLWWVWGADGSTWMVPAYRFIGDDGGWYTVPAITDDYLVEITPPADTAVPLPEPVPTTVPAVDTIPADPSDTSSLQPLVGLSIEEFGANAEAMGWKVRIVEIDGVSQPVTMDFLPDRVNVSVVTNDDASQTVKAIVNVG